MSERAELEQKIVERGKQFFDSIRGEAPSIFNKGWWTGKVMDWCMRNESFKIQMFRFVDVLPYLTTSESLSRHIDEYFGKEEEVPAVLKWGAGNVAGTGLAGKLAGKVLAKTLRGNIEKMARQFIIGENTGEAIKNIRKLRKDGFAVVVDLLGEATVSEAEADAYLADYLELLDALETEQPRWKALRTGDEGPDWGHEPRINVAVKPSAFYSQAKPADPDGSVAGILARVGRIYRKVKSLSGFMCIDMEQRAYKDITIELFKQLRSAPEFRDYDGLGIVFQAYLRETEQDIEELLSWARTNALPISIRLVKGAYWDYETVLARQHGLPVPVHTDKAATDAAFEREAALILKNHDICRLACGSHNIRTISAVMEQAQELQVPESRYEFQVLYGMAEPVRKGLRAVAGRVRLYCPYGQLIPGMAYLVRRLLENTANESFLRQSFSSELDEDRLLADPATLMTAEAPASAPERFENQPEADFTLADERRAFTAAIAQARAQLPRECPLYINGMAVRTDDSIESVNPAEPAEIVGRVAQAGKDEADQALAAAKAAYPGWRATDPAQRAALVRRAADIARKRIHELSAWQILEVGKQWGQAHGDVGEAIDFMEYYARDMLRLARARRCGHAPGERNEYFYEPRGTALVVAPWNFPLAISCGMCSAAMVTGNCVIYKPSNLSPVVGQTLCDIFQEAGFPPGVFNYLPGRGSEIGDYLVSHPDVATIAFTGSMEVGLHIWETAGRTLPGQPQLKRVVCEMGGKNAVIIDDDADLDEAVLQVLYSAFGFQGQKCSACSRVIVLDAIYDRFIERLVEAARSIAIGPAEDPASYMGPVVDTAAQQKIREYIALGKQEGRLLLERDVPDTGCYVPLAIFAEVAPESRLAQEEIFGPVLAVLRAASFEQAVEIANNTRFALTSGVFSRSPQHLEYARTHFRVGNLYLNRGTTGAMVERQAFGGFKLSGGGTKTGGPDYLLHFMDPRVVTENTMRRGFAPADEDE